MSELLDRWGSAEPWTIADLPGDGRRWELVDGVPALSPAPTGAHAVMVNRLAEILRASVDSRRIFHELGIGVGLGDYRVPDLVVVKAGVDVRSLGQLEPAQVALTVEVVSASSKTTDRITKPAQYAAWGVGSFWRVETEPVSVTAYELKPPADVYTQVGCWVPGQTLELDLGFTVQLDVDRLLE